MSEDAPVHPAATVVLLREGGGALEVLLLRRNAKLAFHGGAWVFPGGRVDPGEGTGEEGARRAAVREAREEAGLALDPASLVPLSHWTTPEGQPRRFATWFFVAEAGREEVRVDGSEIHEHHWLAVGDALAAHRAKALDLPPPTFVTLAVLAVHRTPRDALAAAAAAAPTVYVPRIVKGSAGAAALYPGDAGWETRDPGAPGPRHRLLFDPAGWRYVREV